MKFSTSTSLALLSTALIAFVPEKALGRKTRFRTLQEDSGSSGDGEGKGKGKGYSSYDGDGDGESYYGKGKGGKGSSDDEEEECTCDGFFYYQLVEGPSTWIDAYFATPDDCVLSPVASMDELLEIGEAAKGTNAWVGIMKSAGDIADAPDTALTASWYNLDGSEVPDDIELWGANSAASSEPNNFPAYQTRAHWYGTAALKTGLRDINPVVAAGPAVTGAVYKCCALNVNTCYNFPEDEEEEYLGTPMR